MHPVKLLPCLGVLHGLSAGMQTASFAQSEGWMLGPGSRNDQSSEVVPTHCTTFPDGTITCDTELKEAKQRTPARQYYKSLND